MFVRVPASSANLGAGFDSLGMALTLHAEVGLVSPAVAPPPQSRVEGEQHPATVAFRRAGGVGDLWVRCPIPSGRGLGFSGAVRVGGAMLAIVERDGPDHAESVAARDEVLRITTALEGHGDNVAASIHGGVTAIAGDVVVRVPLALDPTVVVWIPPSTTSTDASRRSLPTTLSLADAAFNIGRAALLVAALAAGDLHALRTATEDRIHQDARFEACPNSRAAYRAALEAGAIASWLSGSGPTVAILCHGDDAERISAALPETGRAKTLRIDHEGIVLHRHPPEDTAVT